MPKNKQKQKAAGAMKPLVSFCMAASTLALVANHLGADAFTVVDHRVTHPSRPYHWHLGASPPSTNNANIDNDDAGISQTAPSSAQQQRGGYVTPVGKNEMSDLIDRLGLKKVDNNSGGKKRRKKKKQPTEVAASKDAVNGEDIIVEDNETLQSESKDDPKTSEDNAWDTIVTAVTTQKLVDIVSSKLSGADSDHDKTATETAHLARPATRSLNERKIFCSRLNWTTTKMDTQHCGHSCHPS